ncbi:hypothetical protein [Paenibacillus apiarius]|uniref:Uncharacterized protein n=1 Tax=Paenibacillus apiarius TaxID=46240 RepID=A0ABT4DY71_9BACL|nr:hypothetical protein [Paenibacillus apiarius]MCY9517832.1 hypothetical protein [Paenibacillus apiarius]MCY9522314.1 hypothetical protein [Paenibacillus apiarius]MCY9555093.1 hypothetical protein [Paenibacillus apiarius]MCY9558217.1 hypothetical protein [Paenibacillus apiarius]MCY9684617.1 hypothetical protein [Paenibacillus apiarius]
MNKKSRFLGKCAKTSVATVIGLSFLMPGASFAQEIEETTNAIDYGINGFLGTYPWNNNFKDFTITESQSISSDILYDDEAKAVLDKIKEENNRALQEYDNIKKEEQAYLQQLQMFRITNINSEIRPLAQSKSWYRTEFTALALTFGIYDCPTAGNFLLHSLQDKPEDRNYPAGSSLSNGFSRTSSYTEISIPMASAIKKANSDGKSFVSGSGSHYTSAGNAGLDFYLTIGKYSYNWAAEKKSNGSWKVYININDKYDYDTIDPLPNSFPANAIALVSNHAADAQRAGAIVPYFIHMYMQQDYTP